VYLDINEVDEIKSSSDKLHPLVGYTVMDQENNVRGRISSIEQYPNQMMSFITDGDSTIMLPIHEDNILNLDEGSTSVQIEIPDGLDKLYDS
jgi:ribosomal 30S subunit maturation factor RimM